MRLRRIPPERCPQTVRFIAPDSPGAVYAYSAAEGIQSGMIFTDEAERCLFVRHCCGFAMLYGVWDDEILGEIGQMILHPVPYKRTIFFAPDEKTAAFYGKDPAYTLGRRLFFRYPEDAPELPETHEVTEISAEIIPLLRGFNIPSFSWDTPGEFLQYGGGVCVMKDGVPASWAFSAGVSTQETDIGIETDPNYRRQGLAFTVAAAMIRQIRQAGKMPAWECRAENIASERLAKALGFQQFGECITITRSEQHCTN